MPDEKAKVKERWVCLGRRRADKDHSLFQFWAALTDDNQLGKERAVKKSLVKNATPGVVYEITLVDDGAAMITRGPDAPKYLGIYENTKVVMEWKAEDKAAEASERVERRMRAEISQDQLREALEPIRLACRGTDRIGRLAIKAMVLEYLDL
jgi:hypothetical protein